MRVTAKAVLNYIAPLLSFVERLDNARKIANSRAAKRDLKRRQHLMERSFADATNCHWLKRSRWRGLWKQAIQDLLIATVQELLMRHGEECTPEQITSQQSRSRRAQPRPAPE